MKKKPSLTEVYQIPESPEELEESKCPKCGDPDAYISFNNDVDCPNAKCPNHKGNTNPLGKSGKKNQDDEPKKRAGGTKKLAFIKKIETECDRLYGRGWKDVIDKHQGWPGAADWLLDQIWKGGHEKYWAIGEVGHYVDIAGDPNIKGHGSFNQPAPLVGRGGYVHNKLVRGKVTLPPYQKWNPSKQDFDTMPGRDDDDGID